MSAEPSLHGALQEEGDVGAWKGRRPDGGQPTSAALVGKRRVVVAVGNHDLARRQRGGDHLADQLAAGGHEQVHLGLGVDLEALVQEHVSDLFAQLGASRFAYHHRVVLAQPLAQELRLRRLARTLGALERDEEPAFGHEREA